MENFQIDQLLSEVENLALAGADLQPFVKYMQKCESRKQDQMDPESISILNSLIEVCEKRILSEELAEKANDQFRQDIVKVFQNLNGEQGVTDNEVESPNQVEEIPEPIPLEGCVLGCSFVPEQFRHVCPQGRHSGDPSLVEDFLVEGYEHLDNIEKDLLQIEYEGDNTGAFNSIFRSFHTIKGVAAFLNYVCLKEITHSLETLVDRLRNHKIQIDSEMVDLFLDAVDYTKNYFKNIEIQQKSGERAEVEQIENQLVDLQKRIGYKLEDKANSGKIGEILVRTGKTDEGQINTALEKQKSGDSRPLGEILRKDSGIPAKVVAEAVRKQQSNTNNGIDQTIRVPVNRLDSLIDAVGEVGVAFSMFSNDVTLKKDQNSQLSKKLSRADMLMRQVQGLSFSLRMVSVNALFQKSKRLAWDLARGQKKAIRIHLEGENTEIDKSMVEKIADPLVHLVRNCVDHGIESPEVRNQAGKDSEGNVTLKAYHRSGNVFVEIHDDGKGLDSEKLRLKAIERGLLTEEQEIEERELQRFIFHPGFSTATEITDLSGRGVGMDVVKQNIEALGGVVDIQSAKGKGTIIILRLPLTLANVNGMILRVGREKYIVPTLSILETQRISLDKLHGVFDKEKLLEMRGKLTPIFLLEEVLNIKVEERKNLIVVLLEDVMGRRFGLIVDEILEQQNFVIKQVGEGIGKQPMISGGAVMADGNVCLILDVNGIGKMVF